MREAMDLIRPFVTTWFLVLELAFSLGCQSVSTQAPELDNAVSQTRAMFRVKLIWLFIRECFRVG
jgi:hypothetical protein